MSQIKSIKKDLLNMADSAAKEDFAALLQHFEDRIRYEVYVDVTDEANKTLAEAKASHGLAFLITDKEMTLKAEKSLD